MLGPGRANLLPSLDLRTRHRQPIALLRGPIERRLIVSPSLQAAALQAYPMDQTLLDAAGSLSEGCFNTGQPSQLPRP